MDKFRVETIIATPNPQQLVWAAMHQDYSEEFVYDECNVALRSSGGDLFPEESKAGELIVKHLLDPLSNKKIVLEYFQQFDGFAFFAEYFLIQA